MDKADILVGKGFFRSNFPEILVSQLQGFHTIIMQFQMCVKLLCHEFKKPEAPLYLVTQIGFYYSLVGC